MNSSRTYVEYSFRIDEAFVDTLFSVSPKDENQTNLKASLSYLFDTRVDSSISPAIPGDRSGISNDCWEK